MKVPIKLLVVVLILIIGIPRVFANELSDCQSIQDEQARLSCYDDLAHQFNIPPQDNDIQAPSMVENRLEQESLVSFNEYAITPHKPNYLLPVTYNDNPDSENYDSGDLQRVEVKFQLSFKIPLAQGVLIEHSQLWFAYSQLAFWQMYNTANSSPFRETNYEPEIIWAIHTNNEILGFRNSLISFSLNHQSNGRSDPYSRSWNRLVADFLLEKDNYLLSFRPWYRIPASEGKDDNPDIDEYLGYAEVGGLFKYKDHLSTIMLRNNLRSEDNRTTVELTYTFRFSKRMKGIAQYFNGYGESLIDYNHRNHRLGIGILLTDWL